MDVSGSLHTLRKHWVLTSLLVLVTLVAAVGVWIEIPGPYSSESQVVFLSSRQGSTANGSNPYMSFTGTLSTAADLVRREAMDPRVVAQLASRGYTASYQVADDPAATGPILDVTATGSSKAMVEATQLAATREVQAVLLQMQQGIAPGAQITSLVVSSAPNASLLVSKKARPLVGVLVAGLLLTLAIPQVVDASARRRRERGQPGRRQAPIPMPAAGLTPAQQAHPSGQLTYSAGPRAEPRNPERAEPPWQDVPSTSLY